MKISEYLVNCLIKEHVTDVFGIPGGVVLDFIYALHQQEPQIIPHLCYHEQAAALAACGYAQASGRLGAAYATRGPGFTNLLTGIADAYYDSLPVLFITAHAKTNRPGMRAEYNQEIDPVSLASSITKYAKRIETPDEAAIELQKACYLAQTGRPGPVLLDFSSTLWDKNPGNTAFRAPVQEEKPAISSILAQLEYAIAHAKRPVILIGDGIRHGQNAAFIKQFASRNKIPVLSSRLSQDLLSASAVYFGYIGSHGLRYANFILSKADLLISLGNRLSFPLQSSSFAPLFSQMKIFRLDIDETEFLRPVPNSIPIKINLKDFLPALACKTMNYAHGEQWLEVCRKLQETLFALDMEQPSQIIADILNQLPPKTLITSDVGNNEFWLSRAYAYAGLSNPVLYSKSYGTLGCSLPKAIGAYYAAKQPVACFTGDQGLQMNIQELAFVAQHRLPIQIFILNNHTSGMIKDREQQKYPSCFLHTTKESGYITPDFKKTAEAYRLDYYSWKPGNKLQTNARRPCLTEIEIDEKFSLIPFLKKADACQNLFPYLPDNLLKKLNDM